MCHRLHLSTSYLSCNIHHFAESICPLNRKQNSHVQTLMNSVLTVFRCSPEHAAADDETDTAAADFGTDSAPPVDGTRTCKGQITVGFASLIVVAPSQTEIMSFKTSVLSCLCYLWPVRLNDFMRSCTHAG